MWWVLCLGVATAQSGPLDPPTVDIGPNERELDEATLLRAVERIDPDQHRRLQRLRDRDPELYQTMLRRIRSRLERRASDPEALERGVAIRKLNGELRRLRNEYRTASGNRRVAIRATMVDRGLALFELRQAERRARLRDLRTKLDNLQSEVDQREANKDELVDEYVDGLLAEPPR